MLRPLLVILAALLLSGCWWIGPPFYAADPAAPAPLSAGRWSATNADGSVKESRLVRYPDGRFGPAPGEAQDNGRLSFHPLPLPGRDLWVSQLTSTQGKGDEAIYGLAEVRDGAVELLPLIDCEGNEAAVRAAGGAIKVVPADRTAPPDASGEIDPKNVGTTCLFANAGALERALTAFARHHPRLPGAARLRRVGD